METIQMEESDSFTKSVSVAIPLSTPQQNTLALSPSTSSLYSVDKGSPPQVPFTLTADRPPVHPGGTPFRSFTFGKSNEHKDNPKEDSSPTTYRSLQLCSSFRQLKQELTQRRASSSVHSGDIPDHLTKRNSSFRQRPSRLVSTKGIVRASFAVEKADSVSSEHPTPGLGGSIRNSFYSVGRCSAKQGSFVSAPGGGAGVSLSLSFNNLGNMASSVIASEDMEHSMCSTTMSPIGHSMRIPAQSREIPGAFAKFFSSIDTYDVGYLTLDQSGLLLSALGVELETMIEGDFFTELNATKTGRITLEQFYTTYQSFRPRFLQYHGVVKLNCAIAAEMGVTPDAVLRAWQVYDPTLDHEMTTTEMLALLRDLGLEHTVEEVEECFKEFDFDGNGKMALEEFISMFVTDDSAREEDKFDEWMQELCQVVSSRDIRCSENYLSDEQVREDALTALRRWFEKQYAWVMFFYIQLQVLVPLFLFCFKIYPSSIIESEGTAMYLTLTLYFVLPCSDIIFVYGVFMKGLVPKVSEGSTLFKFSDRIEVYMNSKQFLCDFFILIPFDILVGAFKPGWFLHPSLRLTKLLLLGQNQYHFRQCVVPLFGTRWWRIANALYWWLILAHLIACVFHSICIHQGDVETEVLLTLNDYSSLRMSLQYFQSLSYTVNTMAGLSRGRFPDNDMHASYALFTVVVGVFVYAFVLAVISTSLRVLSRRAQFSMYLEEVREMLSQEGEARLPGEFLKEVMQHYKHMFHTTGHLTMEDNVLEALPPQLTVHIGLVVGRMDLERSTVFHGALSSDEAVYALQRCMQLRVYPPDCHVIVQGEIGETLFILQTGECVVHDNLGDEIHTLTRGDVFGEIALLAGVSRTASVITKTHTNLLEIDATDFNVVMGRFPDIYTQLVQRARQRLQVLRKAMGGRASSTFMEHRPRMSVYRRNSRGTVEGGEGAGSSNALSGNRLCIEIASDPTENTEEQDKMSVDEFEWIRCLDNQSEEAGSKRSPLSTTHNSYREARSPRSAGRPSPRSSPRFHGKSIADSQHSHFPSGSQFLTSLDPT